MACEGMVAALWALAALMCGMLLGFLFGIPRVSQQPSAEPAPGSASNIEDGHSESRARRRNSYDQRVNTNIEEISDWLTKIIVGVSLIQMKEIPAEFQTVVTYLSGTEHNRGVVGAILVLFLVGGFFCGYLGTRLYLAAAFSRADQTAQDIWEAVADAKVQTYNSGLGERKVGTESALEMLLSPRLSVMNAWNGIKEQIGAILEKRGIKPSHSSRGRVEQLESLGILSKEEVAALYSLLRVRDLAQDAHSDEVPSAAGNEYFAAARAVMEKLKVLEQQSAGSPK